MFKLEDHGSKLNAPFDQKGQVLPPVMQALGPDMNIQSRTTMTNGKFEMIYGK